MSVFKLSGFIEPIRNSSVLLPIFKRIDSFDNYLYIAKQNRDFSIDKFLIFNDLKKYRFVHEYVVEETSFESDEFSVGMPGIISITNSFTDNVHHISIYNIVDFRNNNYIEEIYNKKPSYSDYSLLKIKRKSVSSLYSFASKLPLGSEDYWKNLEIISLQRENSIWQRTVSKSPSGPIIQQGLASHAFDTPGEALRWLMSNAHLNPETKPEGADKWIAVWEWLWNFGTDQETLLVLANSALTTYPDWDSRFLRILQKVYHFLDYSTFDPLMERLQEQFEDVGSLIAPDTYETASVYHQIWRYFMIGGHKWVEPKWSMEDDDVGQLLATLSSILRRYRDTDMRPLGDAVDQYWSALAGGALLVGKLQQYSPLAATQVMLVLRSVLKDRHDVRDINTLAQVSLSEFLTVSGTGFRALTKESVKAALNAGISSIDDYELNS